MKFNAALRNESKFSVRLGSFEWNSKAILRLVDSLTALLKASKVKKGDKILLKATNGPEHFIVFLACEALELLYVPVFNEVTPSEYGNIASELGFYREIIFDKKTQSFQIKNNNETSAAQVHSSQHLSGCLFKTSGTTNMQKYVFHSFDSMWENAGIAAAGQNISPFSEILSLLTFSHMGGFCMQALPGLREGATVIIEYKSNYSSVAKNLLTATHTIIVPSMFRYLNDFCGRQKITFPNRPLVVTGSVPVSNETLKQMLSLGFRVQVIYGLTEIGPYVSRYEVNSQNDLKQKEFYLGSPLPGYRIKLDAESGEIVLDGPCKGMAFDPAAQACTPLPQSGSWVKTGDMGTAEGEDIYFSGRSALTINVGGFKVSPQEIESVIIGTGQVEACVVLGEKHFALGEVPVAYVKSQSPNADLINKKIQESLARYKWPRKIVFVENLPETSIGKTKRITPG